MPRYIGLLRGVNVGGKNKVSMSQLRTLFESLGHTEVSTFIQSGNILFTTRRSVTPKSVETAIGSEFGIDITVILRTRDELRSVVEANPFGQVDLSKVHVGFMAQPPSAMAVATLDGERFQPEEFVISGRELYLHLPNGMARTKLPAYIDRRLKVPTTVRSWATVTKLLGLVKL
jgi:uncharacterized protein (DUF1697 family)